MDPNNHAGLGNSIKHHDVSTSDGGEGTIPTVTDDNFINMREKGTYVADKTMLLDRILSDKNADILLFCRPRRFGKSINLTMIEAFLSKKFQGNNWFEGMAIWNTGKYRDIMNTFPVIRIDMLNIELMSMDRAEDSFKRLIWNAFRQHLYLKDSDRLDECQASEYRRVIDGREVYLGDLGLLTELLHTHHGVKAVVLIDEYDTPIHGMLGKDGFQDMISMIRGALVPLIKSNTNVYKIVIMGILQIAKETLFSGTNNLMVSSIMDARGYGEFFGFTQDDIDKICLEDGHPEVMEEIRTYYDGYRIGGHDIYNPYSVMNYFHNMKKPMDYWVRSGSDDEVMKAMCMPGKISFDLSKLLSGDTADIRMDVRVAFPKSGDVADMPGDDLLCYLAQAGYFTVIGVADGVYTIRITNREVSGMFGRMARSWIMDKLGRPDDLADAFLSGDTATVSEEMERIVTQCFNARGLRFESSLQIFVAGVLYNRRTHMVRVERYAGDGVADLAFIPVGDGPAAIIEFKKAKGTWGLGKKAEDALGQIIERRYAEGIRGHPVHMYGVAIGSKKVSVRSDVWDAPRDQALPSP